MTGLRGRAWVSGKYFDNFNHEGHLDHQWCEEKIDFIASAMFLVALLKTHNVKYL